MAAALRLLLRQHAAPPRPPMLRSLFPAPYSKTAAAAATASLPSVCRAPLHPPTLREVTPRKAPPTPKGEPRCCKTVPSTMSDSTKSLLDKLKDLRDSKKSLQDMERNIEEHDAMVRKGLQDRKVANALFRKRLDDLRELLAKIRNKRDYSAKMDAMYRRLEDGYDRDWAIQEAKVRLSDEQFEVLLKKREDYADALRRYHELERSTMEQVEKVKKVAKVGAAVGLVGGLLLILAKM
ncbi:uncharacterized protein LOC124676614 [Lolium rigidum]|uniref:uncharacterized protein LOC124676614 n=1 Tax=Lolium rigidum TaxID=89674 RepID=UPI001F5D3222|nr:uncharacterized protein LOC124676614 [Lolium rigidum]